MPPTRYLNPVLCKNLYRELGSYRKVAARLKDMGIINPYTERPYTHMAVANSVNLNLSVEERAEWEKWL
jgi:hypothetical protein